MCSIDLLMRQALRLQTTPMKRTFPKLMWAILNQEPIHICLKDLVQAHLIHQLQETLFSSKLGSDLSEI